MSANGSEANRHGLKRYIPADVKRKVRQECRFGCVLCGRAFYQYHHFAPEFKDATEHDPEGIALLCGGCHQDATSGRLSAESVKRARRKPAAAKSGWSWGPLDFTSEQPEVTVGGFHFEKCCGPLVTLGKIPVLRLDPPEEDGAPYSLSAIFGDLDRPWVVIEKNEIQMTTYTCDIEISGKVIKFSHPECAGLIVFQMETTPPHAIHISKCRFEYRGINASRQTMQMFLDTPHSAEPIIILNKDDSTYIKALPGTENVIIKGFRVASPYGLIVTHEGFGM